MRVIVLINFMILFMIPKVRTSGIYYIGREKASTTTRTVEDHVDLRIARSSTFQADRNGGAGSSERFGFGMVRSVPPDPELQSGNGKSSILLGDQRGVVLRERPSFQVVKRSVSRTRTRLAQQSKSKTSPAQQIQETKQRSDSTLRHAQLDTKGTGAKAKMSQNLKSSHQAKQRQDGKSSIRKKTEEAKQRQGISGKKTDVKQSHVRLCRRGDKAGDTCKLPAAKKAEKLPSESSGELASASSRRQQAGSRPLKKAKSESEMIDLKKIPPKDDPSMRLPPTGATNRPYENPEYRPPHTVIDISSSRTPSRRPSGDLTPPAGQQITRVPSKQSTWSNTGSLMLDGHLVNARPGDPVRTNSGHLGLKKEVRLKPDEHGTLRTPDGAAVEWPPGGKLTRSKSGDHFQNADPNRVRSWEEKKKGLTSACVDAACFTGLTWNQGSLNRDHYLKNFASNAWVGSASLGRLLAPPLVKVADAIYPDAWWPRRRQKYPEQHDD